MVTPIGRSGDRAIERFEEAFRRGTDAKAEDAGATIRQSREAGRHRLAPGVSPGKAQEKYPREPSAAQREGARSTYLEAGGARHGAFSGSFVAVIALGTIFAFSSAGRSRSIPCFASAAPFPPGSSFTVES